MKDNREKTIWEKHKDRRIQEMRERFKKKCHKGGKLKGEIKNGNE